MKYSAMRFMKSSSKESKISSNAVPRTLERQVAQTKWVFRSHEPDRFHTRCRSFCSSGCSADEQLYSRSSGYSAWMNALSKGARLLRSRIQSKNASPASSLKIGTEHKKHRIAFR